MGHRTITAVLLPEKESISAMGSLEIDRWTLHSAEWDSRWFTTGYETKLWCVSMFIKEFAIKHRTPVIAMSWGGDHEEPFPMVVMYDANGESINMSSNVDFLGRAKTNIETLAK